jgi:hypothetical protein
MIHAHTNLKIYKHSTTDILRMFPSDPTGSLDVYISKLISSYSLFGLVKKRLMGEDHGRNSGFY